MAALDPLSRFSGLFWILSDRCGVSEEVKNEGINWTATGTAQIALAIIATTASLYLLRSIFIPTMLAIFLAYVLGPLVKLVSHRIPGTPIALPRPLSVTVVVLLFIALLGVLGILMSYEIVAFLSEIPMYEPQIADTVSHARAVIAEWQIQLEGLIDPIRPRDGSVEDFTPDTEEQIRVLLDEGNTAWWSSVTGYVFGGITSVLEFTGQFLLCIFVLFFVLLEGPVLKTKMINIMGTTLRKRRLMLEIMQNVNEDVQRYLFNRFVTNLALAGVAWLVYSAFGLKYALLLGALAGIFNFVPYVGPIAGTVFPIAATYMQYGDWWMVLWVMLAYGAMTGIEGNFVTPIVLGRHLKLNSLAVLLACVFWGWLWGPIGLFLAVPIMAVFKAMSEHIASIRPAGELLRG